MNNEKVGKFISELRKEKNLSQYELADMIPIGREAISKWERGKNYPDVQSLIRLSEIFDVTINELLFGERRNKENKKKVEEVPIELFKDRNKKKRMLTVVTMLLAVVFITFLTYYFVNTYNSLKVYTLKYSSEDVIISNGLLVTTRDKVYFNLGEVSSNEEITHLKLYYKDNGIEKLIADLDDTTISFKEYKGYEERIKIDEISKMIKETYLEIKYKNDTKTIKLNFERNFTNDRIYAEDRDKMTSTTEYVNYSDEELTDIIKKKFKHENGFYTYTDKDNVYYRYELNSNLIHMELNNKEWNYHFNTKYLEVRNDNNHFKYKDGNIECLSKNCYLDQNEINYFWKKLNQLVK